MESGELEQFVLSDELSEIQDDSMLGMGPPLSPTQLLHGLWESPKQVWQSGPYAP